jgi:cholesterol transport system auxiliary component
MNASGRCARRMLRRGSLLAAVLALGACASLTGKREPFTVYAPRYMPPSDTAKAQAVAWQLAIDTPLASDALDTSRMLVMPTPGSIETYKSGRWADTMPLMLRSLLIQAFQTSGRIVGVGAVASGLHGDYVLTIDLYDFETQYRDGAPHAIVRLTAKLTDATTNRIATARTFDADAPVGGALAGDAAAAIEQALNTLLPQIVSWTLEQGQAGWTRKDTVPPR